MTKKKSPIKELVKESIKELKNGKFVEDPTLEDSELTGPERFAEAQKNRDEIIIDELLADISTKEGYFIKLKKEIRPNEWMLMKVIENEWRRWADIETAVADIVKEHTKKSPQKWGTGTYRVEISCRGGFRGKRYNPIDVHINADEEFSNSNGISSSSSSIPAVDSSVSFQSNLEQLGQLINVIRGVVPQGPDPNTIQSHIANAFQQGMQIKASESTNMTTLIVGMMSAIMSVIKEIAIANKSEINSSRIVNPEDSLAKMLDVMSKFGVIGQKSEKSAIDFAKELQALGLDLFKKDEPLEQINKLKQIASIASDFMGMGSQDRPSILEKIVDVLGPTIPNMIKDVKETWQTAQQIQQTQKELVMQSPIDKKIGNQLPENENKPISTVKIDESQVKRLLNELYVNIQANNKMYYPIVYTMFCQSQEGIQLLNGLIANQKTTKDIIDLVQQYGDERFKDNEFVMKKMVPYVNGFVIWVRSMAQPNGDRTIAQENTFDVECPVCHAIYAYETEEDFKNEQNKECGANGCKGILKPISIKVEVT